MHLSKLSKKLKNSIKFKYTKRFLVIVQNKILTVLIHTSKTAGPTKIPIAI